MVRRVRISIMLVSGVTIEMVSRETEHLAEEMNLNQYPRTISQPFGRASVAGFVQVSNCLTKKGTA